MFVLLWQFVCVTQYDLPLTVLMSVDLGAAACSWLQATPNVPIHVLKVNRVGEVIGYHGHNVLPPGGLLLRCPLTPSPDLSVRI